jgi:hypothetical protein
LNTPTTAGMSFPLSILPGARLWPEPGASIYQMAAGRK